MNYTIEHDGKLFSPDGLVTNPAEPTNQEKEQAQLAWLKTNPPNLFLYVKRPAKEWTGVGMCKPPECRWSVTTCLGTVLDSSAWVGPRRNIGYGFHTYRRAISCTIYGKFYHGWYFESSGSYCRLRIAKRQPKGKAK